MISQNNSVWPEGDSMEDNRSVLFIENNYIFRHFQMPNKIVLNNSNEENYQKKSGNAFMKVSQGKECIFIFDFLIPKVINIDI